MLNTVRAVVRGGKIELLEPVDLPEGTTVLVTPLIEEDTLFWTRVSHVALDAGEFVLATWAAAGLHVPTAVKRGLYTVHETLILKRVGRLTPTDAEQVSQSLRQWLGLA